MRVLTNEEKIQRIEESLDTLSSQGWEYIVEDYLTFLEARHAELAEDIGEYATAQIRQSIKELSIFINLKAHKEAELEELLNPQDEDDDEVDY